ncbi:MAG: class I SAM-dependent methyltransferase [Bacteroidia bacterium]|nr:class I SAM-dependent methyltransferase [Bacteroidia bacterium]HQU99889.1 class I SAM-dependent methyltransferase [Bacteroidia bacterium]
MLQQFISPVTGNPLQEQNGVLTNHSGEKFPVIHAIPRFVPSDNYASAFGLQWKSFAKIQLDSYNGSTISYDRLLRCFGNNLQQIAQKKLLEVGCGAGRFTEHLIKAGAYVHSVDLSEAVEVNYSNMQGAANYQVAQANVYNLPYAPQSFDVVMCLGVIQHTPNPEKTIEALWNMVKPGGLLVIDHYTFDWMYYLKPILLYRAFLRKMKPERSKKIVERLVRFFFPLHWKYRNSKIATVLLNRISPCYVYIKTFPQMDHDFHYELTRLDTYDGLTDYYKHLRSRKQIENKLKALDAKNIKVWKGGNGVEAMCNK